MFSNWIRVVEQPFYHEPELFSEGLTFSSQSKLFVHYFLNNFLVMDSNHIKLLAAKILPDVCFLHQL